MGLLHLNLRLCRGPPFIPGARILVRHRRLTCKYNMQIQKYKYNYKSISIVGTFFLVVHITQQTRQ